MAARANRRFLDFAACAASLGMTLRRSLALLATVEETGDKEDHCDQEGELGVLQRVDAQADESADDPGGESGEPNPCEVAHMAMMHPVLWMCQSPRSCRAVNYTK